jgi:hypothetical protein
MQPFRALQVRDCQGTLWAFYRRYEDAALASFEGDLMVLDLERLPGSSRAETPVLRRQTQEPQLDFVVVPLTHENIVSLKERLSKPGVLGREGTIVHTQLEVAGEAVLIACDNFHDDCTVASCSVPEEFLRELRSNGVLRGYSEA